MSGRISSYSDALKYLYCFADYERNKPRTRDSMHLAGITALLSELGNPERRLRALHVTGTKGKGSTVAMITSALTAAGYRVGTYTSPHLHTHRERYRLDGEPVGERLFAETLRELQPQIDRVHAARPVTTFEVSTALAFHLFASQPVDWAVIEVGLGGRLDPTNVVIPAAATITPISMDHMEVLGDSIAQIATEKAGIVKPGAPAIVARQPPDALPPILRAAREAATPALLVEQLASATDRYTSGHEWQEFTLSTWLKLGAEPLEALRVRLPLLGATQVDNALTAIATLAALGQEASKLDSRALLEGLSAVRWPGRFEVVSGTVPVVLDGAHNPDSVSRLKAAVAEVFGQRQVAWVFGAGRDHDVAGMLALLTGERAVLCRSAHPRSLPLSDLEAVARGQGLRYTSAPTVADALEAARCIEGTELVVVCGTLFVVAEAREALGLAEAADPVRS